MYKTVWNFMNHHVKSSHVSAMFLAALLAGWTLIGLLAGSVVCLISTMFCGLHRSDFRILWRYLLSVSKNFASQRILYKCTITTRNPKGSLSCLFL